MKNINKKIGAVALSGMMVSGVFLSSVSSVHAGSCTGSPMSCLESVENYSFVVNLSTKYNYSYEQLANQPKHLDKTYTDRWDFRNNIKSLLDKFRNKKDFVNIAIGKSYYRLFFRKFVDDLSQDIYTMVSKAGAEYGFSILYYGNSTSNADVTEILARIRRDFANDQKLMNKLLNEKVLYYSKDMIQNQLKTLNQLFGIDGDNHYAKVVIDNVIFVLKK